MRIVAAARAEIAAFRAAAQAMRDPAHRAADVGVDRMVQSEVS
jgi:hypothetical protein